MNFADLLAKMKSLDEGLEASDKYVSSEVDVEECGSMPTASNAQRPLMGEEGVDECGGMMSPMSAPKQSDSVTMSVSMNGSGKGGIRDLLDVLKNIDQASDGDADGKMVIGMEEFANEPNEMTASIDAVTPTGDDLSSKGAEAEKVNGGGNPMGVDESLINRLTAHYESIKGERIDENWRRMLATSLIQGAREAGSSAVASIVKDTLKQAAGGVMNAVSKTAQAAKPNTLAGPTIAAVPGGAVDQAMNKQSWMDAFEEIANEAEQADEEANEAYNPNSASAEHRRMLDKHKHDTLKAAAEKDDASEADKKRYQAYKDKKEAMRAEFDARMER